MFRVLFDLLRGDLARRVHAMKVTAVLAVAATLCLLVAAGFALSLLYVWLQGLYGTMPALAIIAGGAAIVAVILFLFAFLRPQARRPEPAPRAAPVSDVEAAARTFASTQRSVDEAIAAVQQGSRESMLAALALAAVVGLVLGRKV